MNWKALLSLLICLALLVLMVSGILTGANLRIVVADAVGAVVAGALAQMARPSGKIHVGALAVLLLAIAVSVYLAATAHARPWVFSLTLTGTFTLACLTFAMSSERARVGDQLERR